MKFLKKLFGIKEKDKSYWIVLAQDKYAQGDEVPATYSNYIFESKERALRHMEDINDYNSSFTCMGVAEFHTDLPVTVAVLDYQRCDSHPNPTVYFKRV